MKAPRAFDHFIQTGCGFQDGEDGFGHDFLVYADGWTGVNEIVCGEFPHFCTFVTIAALPNISNV